MLMLLLSLVLGLIPLAGIALVALGGWIATVDGLFTSLILAAISGVFFLNALLEARALGMVPFLKPKQGAAATSGSTARPAAQRAPSGPPAPPPPAAADGVVTESGVVEGVRLYEMPVGYADKSLVSFRAEGSPASRSMVFCGNVQHLRAGRKIRISYKPSPDGNQLVTWE
jgi:hypothetical protein